ncbi:hypothetical protein SDC9_81191 [bioreactor metagenome]|uniref:Uncharacterized protein n=1 Tax=bioreactor metagenome TaxID=1076179 RepID=A0A644Z134_9ZZZZ
MAFEKSVCREYLTADAFFQEKSDDVQSKGQNDKYAANPLGCPGQLRVGGFCLVLGQEGVGHAADGAGQARALAGLEQHHQN